MPKENDYLVFGCDMGTGAELRMFRQDDGDIVLSISDPEPSSEPSIEFCTPFSGGGRHERLWKVLSKFFRDEMKALEKDPTMPPVTRAD